MSTPQLTDFPATREVIAQGIRAGLHLGAQLCVVHHEITLIDQAFGCAVENVGMQADSIMLWLSAGKPITAAAIAQLVERGELDWEDHVCDFIPEFGRQGKEPITIRHLLTHTAGLRRADEIDERLAWDETIARICALPPDENWIPGQRAAYCSSGTWYLLGEVVRRVSKQPLEDYVRNRIFLPLEMSNSWLALKDETLAAVDQRVSSLFDTSAANPRLDPFWNSREGFTQCRPGGSARGPIRELARFDRALLSGGDSILRPETVSTMTSRQRADMFDETFQYKTDCGFGFILNSNRDGFQMPYGYGRYASPETFGHSGNQSSCAFADPRHQLVVAWAFNGMPGERKHQQRQRAMNNAIYEDFGLDSVFQSWSGFSREQ